MQRKNLVMTVASALAITGTATAGSGAFDLHHGFLPQKASSTPSYSNGDWAAAWKKGLTYKSDSRFLQEAKLFGRLHYQYAYTDGTLDTGSGDQDFDSSGEEIRRLRLGGRVKFLDGFTLQGNVNLEDGGFRDDELGFSSIDLVSLSYTQKDFAGFDSLTATYGRLKLAASYQSRLSSNDIKTVERTSVDNFFFANSRVTGFTLGAKRGAFDYGFGVYSSEVDNETIAGWGEGQIYSLHLGHKTDLGDLSIDAIYNNNNDEDPVGFEWGVSLGYHLTAGNWDVTFNALYGNDNNHDGVYGVVILPSTFLIKDKLEAVLRYQYFGSEGQSVSINGRNVGNAVGEDLGLSVPRGDASHSIYAGLNYYLIGNNVKFLTGVEYQTLDGSGVELDSTTLWGTFRLKF